MEIDILDIQNPITRKLLSAIFSSNKDMAIRVISIDKQDKDTVYRIDNAQITNIEEDIDNENALRIWWEEPSPLEAKMVTWSATFEAFEFFINHKAEPTSDNHPDPIRQEGFKAYNDGHLSQENPYEKNTLDHIEWYIGFRRAAELSQK